MEKIDQKELEKRDFKIKINEDIDAVLTMPYQNQMEMLCLDRKIQIVNDKIVPTVDEKDLNNYLTYALKDREIEKALVTHLKKFITEQNT